MFLDGFGALIFVCIAVAVCNTLIGKVLLTFNCSDVLDIR